MAKFTKWADRPGSRRYNRLRGTTSYPVTYQDWANDAGNYNSGIIGDGPIIGTNRSISAPALSAWRGHPVTKEEMMALGLEEAREIMKVQFWDKMLGDKIQSQLIAEFTGDMKSSTGNIRILQNALNNLGAKLSTDGSMGTGTLTALNDTLQRKGEKAVYEQMRIEAIKFFNKLSNRKFGEAQVKHLNEDYPEYEQLAADRKEGTKSNSKKKS